MKKPDFFACNLTIFSTNYQCHSSLLLDEKLGNLLLLLPLSRFLARSLARSISLAALSGLSLFKHSAYILFLLRQNLANWQTTRQCVNPKREERSKQSSIKKQAKKEIQMKSPALESGPAFPHTWDGSQKLTTSFQLVVTPEISLGLNMQTCKWNEMEIGQEERKDTEFPENVCKKKT